MSDLHETTAHVGPQDAHRDPATVLPDPATAVVVVAVPGPGPGNWAGAASAVRVGEEVYLSYRAPASGTPEGPGQMARPDGAHDLVTMTTA